MTLESYINRCIMAYPSLYLHETYEASKIAVLDHTFLTIGSGITWHKSKKYIKCDYTADGMSDEELSAKIDDLINCRDFHVCVNNTQTWNKLKRLDPAYEGLLSRMPDKFKSACIRANNMIDTDIATIRSFGVTETDSDMDISEYSAKSHYRSHNAMLKLRGISKLGDDAPYPFSVKYWPFKNINMKQIELDWLHGIKFCFNHALNWYNTVGLSSDYIVQEDWSNRNDVLTSFRSQYKTGKDMVSAYLDDTVDKSEFDYILPHNLKKLSDDDLRGFIKHFGQFMTIRDITERVNHLNNAITKIDKELKKRNAL